MIYDQEFFKQCGRKGGLSKSSKKLLALKTKSNIPQDKYTFQNIPAWKKYRLRYGIKGKNNVRQHKSS